MRLESAGVRLVIPGPWTTACRSEEPERIGCRPYFFSVYDALGQPDFPVTGPLIKIAFLRGLESPWRLKDHIVHAAYIPKVQATSENPVNPDVTDHQHPLLAFSLGFRPHQPCEESYILGIGFDNGQIPFPPFLTSQRYILCANAYHGADA